MPPRFGVALVGALVVTGLVRAAEVGEEAAKSYRVVTVGSTQRVRMGEKGMLRIAVEPVVPKVHVNAQAPLQVKLEGSTGLKLEKERLGHTDAVEVGAAAPRFEVPFTAVAAGKQEIKARIDFFICSDSWCVRQSQNVNIAVSVKK